MDEKSELIYLDNGLIVRILKMIRDKYYSFDLGTYFLADLGYENAIGFHNIRDMLSHIRTAITENNGLTLRQREDQLTLAEEHLRRALVEPYEIGAAEEFKKARELYEKLQDLVKFLRKGDKHFINGPADENITSQFRSIKKHLEVGRKKKAANLWNAEWEEAVFEFITVTKETQELIDVLQAEINLLTYSNVNKQSRIYFIWAMTATILFGIVSVIGIVIPFLLK
jgi:hypothetical protein